MASASSNVTDVASRLESILQCAICLDLFKEPRILTCGHVFCDVCLRRLVGPQGRTVRCPTCQRPCNVSHMTKVFVLSDVVDAQRSISASPPPQHFCDQCRQATDLDDLWCCDGCDAKTMCSKCMIKNNHGTKCYKNPRNVAEVLVDKQNLLMDWRRAVCDPGFHSLGDHVDQFSGKVDEMRRRILGIRDLLKGEVANRSGDAALIGFRSEMTAIQNLAAPLVRLSVGDPALDDHLVTCEQRMDEVGQKIRALEARIEGQLKKFDWCFTAFDDFTAAVRRVLAEEIAPANQTEITAQAEPTAETMMMDLGISTSRSITPDPSTTLDDSVPLIILEEVQDTDGDTSQ